jgi:hypothetical protein
VEPNRHGEDQEVRGGTCPVYGLEFRLRETITALQEKQQSLRDLRSRMEATGEKEVSLTDPDSRVMKSHGMLEMCYNTQIAVEAKNKIIVEYEVDNKAWVNKALPIDLPLHHPKDRNGKEVVTKGRARPGPAGTAGHPQHGRHA